MKKVLTLFTFLFVSSCTTQSFSIAETWPVFNLEGAVRTSSWIGTGEVIAVSKTDCVYGSFGKALNVQLKVSKAISEITSGHVIQSAVFDGGGAFVPKVGEKYLVFYRPITSTCGAVSASPGFLLINGGDVRTENIVDEPVSQSLSEFANRASETVKRLKGR
jgi:hypothetical protein